MSAPRQPNPHYNGRVPNYYYRDVEPSLELNTVPHSLSVGADVLGAFKVFDNVSVKEVI